MNFKLIAISVLSVMLTACASLNSVSVTQIPANRSNEVSAEADRWIILGFNFDNDYADEVSKTLARKCPGGKISGILTKDEAYMYFLVFVMKKRVVASGYCEKTMAANDRTLPTKKGGRKVNSVTPPEEETSEEPAP